MNTVPEIFTAVFLRTDFFDRLIDPDHGAMIFFGSFHDDTGEIILRIPAGNAGNGGDQNHRSLPPGPRRQTVQPDLQMFPE